MQITYDDKVSLTTSPLPRVNKATAEDFNEIKNVVNTNESTTTQNSSDIQVLQDKVTTKYIKATINTQPSIGSTYQVPLSTVSANIGNKFTLSNNAIYVGEGISKVRASACIFVEAPQGTGYVWGQIRKNNSTQSSSIVPYNNGGGFLSSSIPATIFNVQQGDTITLIADSTCQGNLRKDVGNTWILIEVVE